MVKKGEYLDFAIELEKRVVDFSPNMKGDEITANTELSIILEMVVKIKELEAAKVDFETRIVELEAKTADLEKL